MTRMGKISYEKDFHKKGWEGGEARVRFVSKAYGRGLKSKKGQRNIR